MHRRQSLVADPEPPGVPDPGPPRARNSPPDRPSPLRPHSPTPGPEKSRGTGPAPVVRRAPAGYSSDVVDAFHPPSHRDRGWATLVWSVRLALGATISISPRAR